MRNGFDAIENGSYPEAIKIARSLIKQRHSSGFEILGLALQRQGKITHAIGALEDGTRKAGGVWILWKLLADCYSDAKRYSDAENAYQRANACSGADRDLINLNRGIALRRRGDLRASKDAFRTVAGEKSRLLALTNLIEIAIEERAMDSALDFALQLEPSIKNAARFYSGEWLSRILSTCASGLMHSSVHKTKAKKFAMAAVDSDPSNSDALRIIRELENRPAIHAMGFRFLVEGVWPQTIGRGKIPPGFFRNCSVVAANQKTAQRYMTKLFPKPIQSTLRVCETAQYPPTSIDFEGVYALSGYSLYPRRRRGRGAAS